MDGTRLRRTHDPIRQRWYALQRCIRFANHMNKQKAIKCPTKA